MGTFGTLRTRALSVALAAHASASLGAPALAPDGGAPEGPPAAAAVQPIERLDIEDLLNLPVVTASGKEETRALAAANVVSVTREEIDRNGWRSLAEILESVPGLYVIDDLVLPALSVRGVSGGLGAGTRLVRVMIDGVEVNFRPDLTAFIGREFIPVEAIERVEVARGPLSALYGANAFLATVNVITRRAEQGVHGSVSLRGYRLMDREGYGASTSVSAGGDRGSVLAAVSFDQLDRSGLTIEKTFPAQNPDLPRYAAFFGRPSAGDRSMPLSAFVAARVTPTDKDTVTLEGGLQRLDSMGEFRLNSALTHASRIVLTNFWSALKYERVWSEAVTSGASLGFSRGLPGPDYQLQLTGNNLFDYHPADGYWALTAGLYVNWSPLERLELKAGADFEYQRQTTLYYRQTLLAPQGTSPAGEAIDLIGDGRPREVPAYDLGVYAQGTWAPFDKLPDLHFTANLRVDTIAYGPVTFPAQVSWRAAAAYRFSEKVAAKLVGGRAFQTPSATLLFAQPGFGTSDNVVGTANDVTAAPLRPQVVTSVEAVASARLFDRLSVEGGVFYQTIDDSIGFDKRGSDFAAANHGVQSHLGLELAARLEVWRLQFFASGTALLQLGEADQTVDQYPSAFGRVGVHLDLSQWHLRGTVSALIVGPRGATQANREYNNNHDYTLPTYARLDARLATADLAFLGEGRESRLALVGRNLLDSRYSEPSFGKFDVPALGRTLMVELSQSF